MKKTKTIPTSNAMKSFLLTSNKHSPRVQIKHSHDSPPPMVQHSPHFQNSIVLSAPILANYFLQLTKTSAPKIPKTSSSTTDQLLPAIVEKTPRNNYVNNQLLLDNRRSMSSFRHQNKIVPTTYSSILVYFTFTMTKNKNDHYSNYSKPKTTFDGDESSATNLAA